MGLRFRGVRHLVGRLALHERNPIAWKGTDLDPWLGWSERRGAVETRRRLRAGGGLSGRTVRAEPAADPVVGG
jgi:hypothetical protein